MREFFETFTLSWGKLLGVTAASVFVGGILFSIASEQSIEREGVVCVGGKVEASGEAVVRLTMQCDGAKRAHYTTSAELIATHAATGILKATCSTYRFSDAVKCK